MDLLEILLYFDILCAILSFVTNILYLRLRKKYQERAILIDENIEKTKIEEKENNDLRLFEDDKFNKCIELFIISFIPILNLFLIYLNANYIYFLTKNKK